MTSYAGLDVAEQATHVCVVEETGKVVFRGVCRTEPAARHELLAKRAPGLGRVVLDTIRNRQNSAAGFRRRRTGRG